MAARDGIRAAKKLLRKAIKERVALLSDSRKEQESMQVAKKVPLKN